MRAAIGRWVLAFLIGLIVGDHTSMGQWLAWLDTPQTWREQRHKQIETVVEKV